MFSIFGYPVYSYTIASLQSQVKYRCIVTVHLIGGSEVASLPVKFWTKPQGLGLIGYTTNYVSECLQYLIVYFYN